jgi:hypothetical protein
MLRLVKSKLFLALLLAGILSSSPITLPTMAAPSQVSRVSIQQATNGYNLPATYDMDQVIKLENDRIINVWPSNMNLFNPRFSQGGKVIVLSANATPQDLKVLPEIGRELGTLTVELESGNVIVVNLVYSPAPQRKIVTFFLGGDVPGATPLKPLQIQPATTEARLLSPAEAQDIPRFPPRVQHISQDGFVSPLAAKEEPISAMPKLPGTENLPVPGVQVLSAPVQKLQQDGVPSMAPQAKPQNQEPAAVAPSPPAPVNPQIAPNSATAPIAKTPVEPAKSTPTEKDRVVVAQNQSTDRAALPKEPLVANDYVRRGSPRQLLARTEIPLDDGSKVPADKLLDVQSPEIWGIKKGMYRKSLGYFLDALANSQEPTSEARLQDALKRTGSEFTLNDAKWLATVAVKGQSTKTSSIKGG